MSRVFLYSYKQNHKAFFSSSLEMKRVLKYLYFCPKFFLFFLTVLGLHLALNFKTNTPSETPTTRLDTEIKLIPVCSARNPNMRRDNVSIAPPPPPPPPIRRKAAPPPPPPPPPPIDRLKI